MNNARGKGGRRAGRVAAALLAAAALGGCASGALPNAGSQPAAANTASTVSSWPVTTQEHVDLWLHGFAMIQDDTTKVPFFAPGYRERMAAEKSRRQVSTQLDANRDLLRARYSANPGLVNAQFLALYFDSWEQLQAGVTLFLNANGNAGATSDPQSAAVITLLASTFTTAADRDWLRTFVQSLADEQQRFYQQYWTERQSALAPVVTRLDSLWNRVYGPKLTVFLNNTQMAAGSFELSLPLDGEGRTISDSKRQNIVAVGFPGTPDSAVSAIYVFAHEAVGSLASAAISDNTTPNEKRDGAMQRYISPAQVRGGEVLLKRVAPDLAEGYARYYLATSRTSYSGDPVTALERAFPLPDAIRDGMLRQIDIVLGGI